MKIVHFHNGAGGGVLSVIRNLLLYQQESNIEQHIVYTINSNYPPSSKIHPLKRAKTEEYFHYSPHWNFYYTCRQLAKYVPDQDSVIVANDWLELGMISHLGLSNPVVMILHGNYDYYYDLAIRHESNIDVFICVALYITENLKNLLPSRKEDIYYQRFPVSNLQKKTEYSRIKKLLFVGRCEKEKGYHLLPIIEQKLKIINCEVSWTIIGDGKDFANVIWPPDSNVKFLKEIPNENVLEIIPKHDILILPSIAEGMPVSVVEAMKSGLVPFVNDLKGGIDELVEDGINGFKIKNNDCNQYALLISSICTNNDLLEQLSKSCMQKSDKLFNPYRNTNEFENLFYKASYEKRDKLPRKIYGSFMDKKIFPNSLVLLVRNIISAIGYNGIRNKKLFKHL